MKKVITIMAIIVATSLSFVKSHSHGPATTARVFATGAPGETHCSSCHTGGNYSGDIFVREILQQAEVNGYIKGATHAIMVEFLSPDTFKNGGIQFVVLDTAGNQAGWVLPPNTPNSPIANRFNWFRKLYLEHDKPITAARVGNLRKIYMAAAWIPSPFYDGPVTIHAGIAACNGNGAVTGDIGFDGQLTLYPARPLLAEGDSIDNTTEYPQQEISATYQSGRLRIHINMDEAESIQMEVLNINGQRVIRETLYIDKGSNKVDVMQTLPEGMYWLVAQDNEGRSPALSTRFLVLN